MKTCYDGAIQAELKEFWNMYCNKMKCTNSYKRYYLTIWEQLIFAIPGRLIKIDLEQHTISDIPD